MGQNESSCLGECGSSDSWCIHRKQERKFLHIWDKTSSLRVKVNTLLAGNGFELEPKVVSSFLGE